MADATSILQKSNGKVWSYYLPIDQDIANQFIHSNNRRVVATINDLLKIQCALMPSSKGWFILLNQKRKNSLGIELGDEVRIKLEKDQSAYGMEMPDELAELLRQDDEGNTLFESLTMGKRRSLIYIVSQVKNTNSRLNKALAIVHHLKESKGNIDYKILNQRIKEYNNR